MGRGIVRKAAKAVAAAMVLVTLFVLVTPAEAATATRLDINPGAGASYPQSFVSFNGYTYIATRYALWRTTGGTPELVKSFRKGIVSKLVVFWNMLLFGAGDDDSRAGIELWRSTGTAAGTQLVMDIASGDSWPTNLTAVGDVVYFRAWTPEYGHELWRTDGSAQGTRLVRDISQGNSNSYPSNLTAVGTTLYFAAQGGGYGNELWRSDGTTFGTLLVADLQPGVGGSDPAWLTPVGQTLYFAAYAGDMRSEFRVQGTGSPQVLSKFSPEGPPAVVGSLLYVPSHYDLWKTDGTDAGSVRVVSSTSYSIKYVYPRNPTAVGSTVYFAASHSGGTGGDLWKVQSPSTSAQPVVANFGPGLGPFITAGARIYFMGQQRASGNELWTTGGTAGTTSIVRDIRPGGESSYVSNWTVLGDQLWFSADDGSTGQEAWRVTP